jgi:hypothetical protein
MGWFILRIDRLNSGLLSGDPRLKDLSKKVGLPEITNDPKGYYHSWIACDLVLGRLCFESTPSNTTLPDD